MWEEMAIDDKEKNTARTKGGGWGAPLLLKVGMVKDLEELDKGFGLFGGVHFYFIFYFFLECGCLQCWVSFCCTEK